MSAATKSSSCACGLFADWVVNRRNIKIQLVLLGYRLTRRLWTAGTVARVLGLPFFILYRIIVEWLLGIELGWRVNIGPRLRLYHAMGLVVHPSAVIGSDCVLRHGTTLGTKVSGGIAPRLGDYVDVGCGSIILGEIAIGNGAVIGAGSVVLKDVPAGDVVAGNPASSIRPNLADPKEAKPFAITSDK